MTPNGPIKNTLRKFVHFCLCVGPELDGCDGTDYGEATDKTGNCRPTLSHEENVGYEQDKEETGGIVNKCFINKGFDSSNNMIIINHCAKCCHASGSDACSKNRIENSQERSKYLAVDNLIRGHNRQAVGGLDQHEARRNHFSKSKYKKPRNKEQRYNKETREANLSSTAIHHLPPPPAIPLPSTPLQTSTDKKMYKKSGKPSSAMRKMKKNASSRIRRRRRYGDETCDDDRRRYADTCVDTSSVVSLKSEDFSGDKSTVGYGKSKSHEDKSCKSDRKSKRSKKSSFRRHAFDKYHKMIKV